MASAPEAMAPMAKVSICLDIVVHIVLNLCDYRSLLINRLPFRRYPRSGDIGLVTRCAPNEAWFC